jgi:hypothetical protein
MATLTATPVETTHSVRYSVRGWGCSSVAEHLPGSHEALDLISALEKKSAEKKRLK